MATKKTCQPQRPLDVRFAKAAGSVGQGPAGPAGPQGPAGPAGATGTSDELARPPVRVAAVTNISLTGTYTHQGVALDVGDRVGAFGQTDGTQGGVYVVAAGAWTRATDFDASADCVTGMGGLILEGSYNGGRWTLITEAPITLNTTPLSFQVDPFVDATGADGVALTVASGVPSLTKIGNAHVTDNTLALSKLTTGGVGDAGKVPVVNGAGVLALAAAPAAGVTPLTEQAAALTTRSSAQYSWLSITDDGTRTQVRPHTRMPRCRVRAVSTSNVVITSGEISFTFGGLAGAFALKRNDLIWIGGQTDPAENGIYRVWQIVGSVASITRMTLIDAFFAASGLYVHVQTGTSADTYWLALGNASVVAAKTLPKPSVSHISWTNVPIEDYVLPGDNTTLDNGNWQPVVARAQQCMHFVGGWLVFDGTYRFTSKIIIWNRTGLRGAHAANLPDSTASRLVFRSCGGVFGPALGETWETIAYDAGIRARIYLKDLNFSFEQGSSDDHYGVLGHCYAQIIRCTFTNPYGNGITLDSQIPNAGTNGSSIVDTLVNGAGLNGFWLKGADANNIALTRCRSTNHAQRGLGAREFEPTTGHPSATSPALTLNSKLRAYTGTIPNGAGSGNQVTLTGTLAFGAGACPLIRVEIDSVAGGTARGQATFRVSYDWDIGTSGAGATWAYSGVLTAATYALDGPATGLTLNFPVGTYATNQAWNGSIFPGADWGAIDDAFIGSYFEMCEFSSGLAGGVFSENSLSVYSKIYQEIGTESDVTGSIFLGGNPDRRAGGNSSRLPRIHVGTDNAVRLPGLVMSDSNVPAAANVSRGVSHIRRIQAISGDTTGYALRIPTANTTISEGWSTNDSGLDRFRTLSNHALGHSCQGFMRGVWIGTGFRQHVIARASLPVTGVPLTSTGALVATDGAYPVGSWAWAAAPGLAALGYRVLTNSGSAAYNLTWGEVANPSCDMVALATGDQTRLITDGGHFVMAASTTAAASVITLGTTGALKGARMRFTIKAQGHNVSLVNGGAGGTGAQLTKVLTAGSEYEADYKFDGTNWIGSAWVCI